MPDYPELAGKVAVVTGGASGIGRACVKAYAAQGVSVVIADRDDAAGRATLDGLPPGSTAIFVSTDVTDAESVTAMVQAAVDTFGGLDIAYNNAGVEAAGRAVAEMTDRDWQRVIDVNLTGTANVVRVFAPILLQRGGGRIIVTSSTQGQHGTKFGSAYSASKWGIIGLMKSAALELGAHNITVNAVIPGLVNTALTRHEGRYAQVIDEAGGTPSGEPAQDERTAVELLTKKTPLGVPWVEPADVAPLVVFLASDQAGKVSGTSFAATGGDSAHLTA